jgi:hypothetical protein
MMLGECEVSERMPTWTGSALAAPVAPASMAVVARRPKVLRVMESISFPPLDRWLSFG